MILVDVKYEKIGYECDCLIDETLTVRDFINEVEKYIPIDTEKAVVKSLRNNSLLTEDESLEKQGILGGDTMVLEVE